MNVAIAGFTAAGKTTHAKLLARDEAREHVWAAGRLLAKLGHDVETADESVVWYRGVDAIAERRADVSVDDEVDREIDDLARSRSDLVIDARFYPWVASTDCVFVWLQSSIASRARKCQVSLSGSVDPPFEECLRHLEHKDALDTAMVRSRFGAAFEPAVERFSVVLDNSGLIPSATQACAAGGIRTFHPYLVAAIRAVEGDTRGLERLRREDQGLFGQIVHHVSGTPFDATT